MALEIGAASVSGLNPALTNSIGSSQQQIATGKKDPADNPAGIQVILQFTGQINGNQAAVRNSNDGISALQVAQGGISSVTDSLQQLRELSVQAGNGTLSSENRASLQNQADEILEGIRDTIGQSEFNGRSLLNDSSNLSLQTGADSGETQDVQGFDLAQQFDDLDLFDLDLTSGDISDALESIDGSLDVVNSAASEFGASQTRLESTITNLDTSTLNQAAARSQIQDADIAEASSQLAKDQIQREVELAMLGQANANRAQVLSLLS